MERIPLIDVFETPEISIIHSLERFDVPWKNNTYFVPSDMDYVFNHSATRIISRMVFILLNGNEKLTQNAIDILAETIYKMYSRKWNKLYETYNIQYNPIENYDMTEEMTDDTTEHEFNRTNTRTDNLTGTDENKIKGFNSSDYNDSTFEEVKNTGTQTYADTGKNTDTRNYTLIRHGNIGVTTSQQMIESERSLWEYDFVQMVYHDLDRVLTVDYYK